MDFGVEQLTQGYGGSSVYDDFTCRFGGGIFGLLGPNGAGKTTLLNTLATVIPPQAGAVIRDGQPVTNRDALRDLRRSLGYLPQQFGYFADFTVRDFVTYAAWLREVPRSGRTAQVMDALDRVGLADRKSSKMRALSGGMLRRAGIATAIVGGPQIILLDEPTVGLDPEQRLDFRQLLRDLDASTVILSTHLIEDVVAVCDRVGVLSHGAVLYDGQPDGLAQLVASTTLPSGIASAHEQGYLAVLASGATQ